MNDSTRSTWKENEWCSFRKQITVCNMIKVLISVFFSQVYFSLSSPTFSFFLLPYSLSWNDFSHFLSFSILSLPLTMFYSFVINHTSSHSDFFLSFLLFLKLLTCYARNFKEIILVLNSASSLELVTHQTMVIQIILFPFSMKVSTSKCSWKLLYKNQLHPGQ